MSHDFRWRGSCRNTSIGPCSSFGESYDSTRRDSEGRWLWRLVRLLGFRSHERLFGIAKPKATPMTMPILIPTGSFCETTPKTIPNVMPITNQMALNLTAGFGDFSFMFDGENAIL